MDEAVEEGLHSVALHGRVSNKLAGEYSGRCSTHLHTCLCPYLSLFEIGSVNTASVIYLSFFFFFRWHASPPQRGHGIHGTAKRGIP